MINFLRTLSVFGVLEILLKRLEIEFNGCLSVFFSAPGEIQTPVNNERRLFDVVARLFIIKKQSGIL